MPWHFAAVAPDMGRRGRRVLLDSFCGNAIDIVSGNSQTWYCPG